MGGLRTKTSGERQLQEMDHQTGTFRYRDGVKTSHKQDLITRGEVDVLSDQIAELLPENAASLDGEHLTIFSSSTVRYTGYLSLDAAANYKAGHPAGSNVTYLIKDPDFTLETPDPANGISDGDKGALELYINGVLKDSFDLEGAFDDGFKDTSQSYTPANSANGYITVASVEKFNNFSAWQKVVARLNISEADLLVGHNAISLKHAGLNNEQVSQDFDVFYDNANQDPVLGVVDVRIHSNDAPKYLSGVRFMGLGDAIKVSTNCDHIADNSYVLNPLDLYEFKGAPTTVIAPTDEAVSGLSSTIEKGESLVLTDKIINLSTANQCSANARLTARPRDPFGTYATALSASQKMLVSTFGESSSNTAEYFNDEKYRLPLDFDFDDKVSPVTNVWDSQALLSNGNAQRYVISDNEHGLVYPDQDFTSFLPENTADYDQFSGDQQDVRCFISPNSKSSVQLTLKGVTSGVSQKGSGVVNVEVKLPTQTGWLDCAKPYDSSVGVASDGDGCLSGSVNYSGGNAVINATFGGKVTFDANNRMYFRITLRDGSQIVKEVLTNW